MRPIRVYFLVYSDLVGWVSNVYRDLDDVLSAWEVARQHEGATGFVHIGISRPPNREFQDLAQKFPNRLLLTDSARWALNEQGTYSSCVGQVGDQNMYLALTGWGYSCERYPNNRDHIENNGPNDEEAANNKQPASRINYPPWLRNLQKVSPSLFKTATDFGIMDDRSYFSLERELPQDVRRKLGFSRMMSLLEYYEKDDPIWVARCAPPWLSSATFGRLKVTVRCNNALTSAGITKVSDLLGRTVDDLLRIPNFGRKSQSDLAVALRNAVKEGPIINAYEGDNEPAPAGDIDSPSDDRAVVAYVETEERPSSTVVGYLTFESAFESNFRKLKEVRQHVIQRRIGIGEDPMTLQEISDGMGVTRERVRQIEAQGVRDFQLDPVWEVDLLPRLTKLLDGREDPLPVDSLAFFDPWFSNIENLLPQLRFVLDRILANEFHIIEVNACNFMTRLSLVEWEQAVGHAINILDAEAPNKPSLTQVRRQVEDLLSGKGSELAGELWGMVRKISYFAEDKDGTSILIGARKSAEILVAAALESTLRPLHFTEIPKKVYELFGKTVEVRRAHSAAIAVGLLFGRGTYGAWRHYPLNSDEISLLCSESEEIIIAGPAGRQWTCFEIVEKLGASGLAFIEHVDQYILNIALRESKILSNLGRFVWAQAKDYSASTSDRIDVFEAALSVLEVAGKPMTVAEIREKLVRERGLSGYFQLQPRGSLVRVGLGKFGILERDVPLTADERRNMILALETLLHARGTGIHVAEVSTLLVKVFPAVSRVRDPYLIFSLAQVDSRFNISPGNYVYLQQWEGPRRLTLNEAVHETLHGAGSDGLKISDIAARATVLLGRSIPRESIYQGLSAAGARYDEQTSRWSTSNDADEDASITADL